MSLKETNPTHKTNKTMHIMIFRMLRKIYANEENELLVIIVRGEHLDQTRTGFRAELVWENSKDHGSD